MRADPFKRGERIYASGFLTGVVCTGFIKRDHKGREVIMIEFDLTRNRMWFPLDRIMKDYDL